MNLSYIIMYTPRINQIADKNSYTLCHGTQGMFGWLPIIRHIFARSLRLRLPVRQRTTEFLSTKVDKKSVWCSLININVIFNPCLVTIHKISTSTAVTPQHLVVFTFNQPPRQNAHHFADDISKRIFLNENSRIFSKGPLDNKSAFVQVMAWCRLGDQYLSDTRIYAALGGGGWIDVVQLALKLNVVILVNLDDGYGFHSINIICQIC